MDNYCLYRHTSPSGKCYIGITKRNPIDRWGQNGCNYLKPNKSGTPKHPIFCNAILKYGWDNIKHEVLFDHLDKDRACRLEQELIRHYKNLNLSYNVTNGGDGVLGYKFTPEQLKRLSDSHKGIKQSKESIEKRVKKNTGKRRTDAQKMKRSKPVLQFSQDGQFIAEYFGINEAGRKTGINSAHIGNCCNNRPNRRTAGGFIWKWKNNNNSQQNEFKDKLNLEL